MPAEPLNSISAMDLIARCGSSDDPTLWNEFLSRYHRRIILYVIRERRAYGQSGDEQTALADISQEVYLRLLSNERSALREFRGSSEAAFFSYLGCVVHSVVSDQIRRDSRQKRAAQHVSLEEERADAEGLRLADILPASDESAPDRMLDERLAPERFRVLLTSALNGNNAGRDALIFQLHVLNGLSMREISEIDSLKISLVNVEAIVRRTRERLRVALEKADSPGISG